MKTLLMKMRNILALATLAMVCITATARPIRHCKPHPHFMRTTIVVLKAGYVTLMGEYLEWHSK